MIDTLDLHAILAAYARADEARDRMPELYDAREAEAKWLVLKYARALVEAAAERDELRESHANHVSGYSATVECVKQKEAQLANLRALLARAGEAMEPFAEQADYWNGDPDDETLSTCNDEGECSALNFALKDLRHAAVVLAEIRATQTGEGA